MVGKGCGLHHVHTAYKWGLHIHLEDAENTLRRTWIATASLRNGYSTFTEVWAKLVACMKFDNDDFDAEVVSLCSLLSLRRPYCESLT